MTRQKHIVINASTAATGGGLLVALDIIKTLSLNMNYRITLVCPDINVYQKLTINAHIEFVPRHILKFYTRWWLDFIWLKKFFKKLNPDLIISLGNLPAITSVPQIMFNDNAFVSELSLKGFNLSIREFIVHNIRKWLFHRRLKYVKILIVQSAFEKNKFEKNYKKLPEIKCLAPLIPSHLKGSELLHHTLPPKRINQLRLACLSYIHAHKNIEILSDVLNIAEKELFPLQLIFTLSPASSILTKRIKLKLKKHFSLGTAINLGKIRPGQIGNLMNQLDGLILPSLNESYSLNYFEASYFKKPLFVSNKPFTKEICGESALYFNPCNAKDIFQTIIDYFKNKNNIDRNNSCELPYSKPDDLYNLINNFW